ncbi:MAG: hypothetical protein ACRD3N_03035 [Terracidiphilus sp.]
MKTHAEGRSMNRLYFLAGQPTTPPFAANNPAAAPVNPSPALTPRS